MEYYEIASWIFGFMFFGSFVIMASAYFFGESALFIGMFVLIMSMFPLMVQHSGRVDAMSERCEELGGFPLVGDRGHFKGCFATELIPLNMDDE